jgi:hypothetical protein
VDLLVLVLLLVLLLLSWTYGNLVGLEVLGVPSMISAAFLTGAWREAGGSQLISLLGTYSGTRNLRVIIYTPTMVIWGIQCGGDNMATVVCACYGSKVVLYRTLVSSRQRGERAGKGKWESW